MPFCDYLDDSATVRDVMGHQATRYAPLENFTHDLMRGESPFSVAERELIAAYTSGLNVCQFCYRAHLAGAEAFGVAPELIEGLIKNPDGATAVDDRLRPVLSFVLKLSVEPARVTKSDTDAVLAAGWGEDALHATPAIWLQNTASAYSVNSQTPSPCLARPSASSLCKCASSERMAKRCILSGVSS